MKEDNITSDGNEIENAASETKTKSNESSSKSKRE